jgi:hypothetical protein
VKDITYLETGGHIDCALEAAVLHVFHRMYGKGGFCISKKWRGATVARDRASTVMGQRSDERLSSLS